MKRLFSFIVILFIMISFVPATYADSNICFTAINDTMLDLSDSTMPYRPSSGIIYVPASVFDSRAIGVSFVENKEKMTATLFNRDITLTFDLGLGISYDRNNNALSGKAMTRNGVTFVPAAFVCGVFGLTYSYIDVETAGIVRIKSSAAVLDDNRFKNSISDSMHSRYEKYIAAKNPASSPGGTTPGTATPEPAPPPAKHVYLTFDDGPNSNTPDILDILDEYDIKATFFVQGVYMAKGDDTIRRIVASGHSIGIHSYTHDAKIFYSSKEAMLEELSLCNELLEMIATTKTRLVRLPYGSHPYFNRDRELQNTLIDAGYRFWDWNIDSEDSVSGATADKVVAHTISELKKMNTTAVVLMHDKKLTAAALPRILEYIKRENYIVSVISESDRPINKQNDFR